MGLVVHNLQDRMDRLNRKKGNKVGEHRTRNIKRFNQSIVKADHSTNNFSDKLGTEVEEFRRQSSVRDQEIRSHYT